MLTSLKTLLKEIPDLHADLGQQRFNVREIVSAINNAINTIWPKWHILVVDETLTYAADALEYTIPSSMEDPVEIWLEPTTSGQPWKQVTEWDVYNDKIHFRKVYRSYDGQTMRIVGVKKPTTFLNVRGESGTINSTTFTDSTASFVTDGVQANDELHIVQSGSNDVAVGKYLVSTVDSETQLTLSSGGPTNIGSCVYTIIRPSQTTDIPYVYLLHMSAHFLYLMWFNRGVGKDVDMAGQRANFYAELAVSKLEELKKRHRVRRL